MVISHSFSASLIETISLEYKHFATKIQRQLWNVLQFKVANSVGIHIQKITSFNNGSSVKVDIMLSLLRKDSITSLVQRSLIIQSTQSILTNGDLSLLNISNSHSFTFVRGKHTKYR